MEPSYLDLEDLIRDAKQKRNEALGELFSAGWKKFKPLLAVLDYRGQRPTDATNQSKLIHDLP